MLLRILGLVFWILSSVAFGIWQQSFWAGVFMLGALLLVDQRSFD